jgi:uncharacterized protein YggE
MQTLVTLVPPGAPNASRIPILACALLFLASPAQAQTGANLSSIRVNAASTITANPDRARIDVGVVTQAPQSQAAVSQNARTFNTVLASLRKAFGPGADIKTLSYSLTPDYQYHASSGQPTINSYTATNVVRVTIDDLGKIGDVIDMATQAGANRVPSIQFALRDEQSVRTQALRDAAVKARAEADALASALGLKVNRILTVEESGPVAVPVRDVMFARAESTSAATSIQPGTLEVNASVTLTVEVSAR